MKVRNVTDRNKPVMQGIRADFVLDYDIYLWEEDWNGQCFTKGYKNNNKDEVINHKFIPVYRYNKFEEHIIIEFKEEE